MQAKSIEDYQAIQEASRSAVKRSPIWDQMEQASKVVGGQMRWGKDEQGGDRIVKIDRVERLPNGSVAWHLTNLADGSESYTQGPINPKYVLVQTQQPPA